MFRKAPDSCSAMSMSHCVPDWDGPAGELDAVLATADCVAPVVKGKFGPLPPKNVALVQDSYEVPSQWTVDGNITRNSNPEWQGVCIDDWPGEQDPGDAVTPSKPTFSPSPCKEGCLAVDVPVLNITMNNDPDQDDEMVSWLQYPLDATLERNYCTDFFGQLPDSNMSNLQSLRDSFVVGQSSIPGRPGRTLPTMNAASNEFLSRPTSADAAMAQGAGRAAGVLPQAGVEAFTKVRTTMQYQGTKWSPSSNPSANPVKSAPLPTSLTPETRTSPVASSLSSSLLPPTYQPIALQSSKAGPMNFSHFSGPAAKMKANLQGLGVSHAGVNPLKNPATGSRPFDVNVSSGTSMIESSTTRLASGVSDEDANVVVQESGTQLGTLGGKPTWPAAMQNPRSSETGGAAVEDHTPADDNPGNQEKPPSPPATASEAPVADPTRFTRGELQDRPEPTLTSSPGTSRNSSDKGKGSTRGKRRVREDESECQSDDAEEEVAVVDDMKKPQSRGPTMKRTRAAEVHNLSERRRRDRINERMKALQELIPNSNKADKASMLDEAIEYLKMLQVQLQMMSMRSGLGIPSLIPTGLQHLQMGAMGAMPPLGISMGMGLGMGMGPMVGMGMGMLDMNSLAARPSHLVPHPPHGGPPLSGSSLLSHSPHGGSSFNVPQMVPLPAHGGTSYSVSQLMPHPSHGVPPHTLSATSPAVSLVDSQDTRLRSSSPAESVYLARQRNLQMNPQTMEVYNPYMIHNQQQQLQHQQEHHYQPNQRQSNQQQHQPNSQHQQRGATRNIVPGGGSQ